MNTKLHQVPFHPEMLMGWLTIFLLFALFLAAILHWKVSRHWSLLAFAIAALWFLLGYAIFLFGPTLLRGTWTDEISARQTINALITASRWIEIAGLILGGIGAIGSICRAVKLGRRKGEE